MDAAGWPYRLVRNFYFLTFSWNDWLLVGMLIMIIVAYFRGYASQPALDILVLLSTVTVAKATSFSLKSGAQNEGISGIRIFLVGLILLLTISSWCHLDMTNNFYHGPRWMGGWNNPNDYGTLMSAGMVLATGLLVTNLNFRDRSSKSIDNTSFWLLQAILVLATFMMGTGLVLSYSRGSWLGTMIGLLYLAGAYGKFKWKYILPGIFLSMVAVWGFWNATPDSSPWFIKRLDFGRPSAQHRVAAWKAGFEIMWDQPFGIGWNKAVDVYEKYYSPPKNGAAAISTNDYLMMGTQLGLPGLLCFVAYVALQLEVGRWKWRVGEKPARRDTRPTTLDMGFEICDSTQIACRAGAIVFPVAFWFDGGLFKLSTATVFWILLELGSDRHRTKIATVQPA